MYLVLTKAATEYLNIRLDQIITGFTGVITLSPDQTYVQILHCYDSHVDILNEEGDIPVDYAISNEMSEMLS